MADESKKPEDGKKESEDELKSEEKESPKRKEEETKKKPEKNKKATLLPASWKVDVKFKWLAWAVCVVLGLLIWGVVNQTFYSTPKLQEEASVSKKTSEEALRIARETDDREKEDRKTEKVAALLEKKLEGELKELKEFAERAEKASAEAKNAIDELKAKAVTSTPGHRSHDAKLDELARSLGIIKGIEPPPDLILLELLERIKQKETDRDRITKAIKELLQSSTAKEKEEKKAVEPPSPEKEKPGVSEKTSEKEPEEKPDVSETPESSPLEKAEDTHPEPSEEKP